MKNITLITLLLVFYAALYPQTKEIKIIKNTNAPKFGKVEYKFEKIYSIGEFLNEPDYKLLSPASLAVDNNGNLFVLDIEKQIIRKYNSRGEHILTIGKRGEEPGEFLMPRHILIRNNQLVVFDIELSRLSFFNLKGDFIKIIQIENLQWMPTSVYIDKNILCLGGNVFGDENEQIPALMRYSLDGELKDTIFIDEMEYYKSDKKIYPDFILDNESGFYVYDLGARKKYTIEKYNFTGELLRVIMKDYKPIKYSKNEIAGSKLNKLRTLFPGIIYPDYKNIFRSVWITENDYLCVCSLDDNNTYGIDIYNQEGFYLARLPLEISAKVLYKNNILYQIELDDNDSPVISAYKFSFKLPKK